MHLHPYYEETFGMAAGAFAGRIEGVDQSPQPAAVSRDDARRAGICGARRQGDGLGHAFQGKIGAFTEVRGATRDDVIAVAKIHKARFNTADYTLGQFSFSLISKFYGEFLGRCVFLVHVSDGRIDGYVVGGLGSEIFAVQRRFSLKHLPQCCWETLCRPHLWSAAYRFLRRSFLPQPTKFVEILAPHLPRLLSLAVDEAAQGSGAAAALVKAFEASICRRYAGYTLSVLKTNLQAVRFYEKLGLEIIVDAFPRSFVFQKQFEPSVERKSREPHVPLP